MDHDGLMERLAAAAPVPAGALDAGEELIAGLAASVAAGPARRRRGRRRTVAMVLAVLAAGAGTAAAGTQLAARTGWFGDPGLTEEDGSEWLRTDAPDFGAVARDLVPRDIALPPGVAWEPEIARLVAVGRREPGLQQETGVRFTFVSYARCAWSVAWLDATASGDAGLRRRAEGVLAAAPLWPIVAVVDGGGVRGLWRARADAARRGDVAAMREDAMVTCDGFGLGTGA
ncbi:MAG: hypothetical protein QOD86_2267 [Miltoncostaeaceae bacterium]|jgi:hypothetical protein|nr:hypothetical protein [Miltoncostaeaceae bacterium]